MSKSIKPLQSEKFMKAVLEYMEPFQGTHNYQPIINGHMEKTEQIEAGYGRWLQNLLTYLVQQFNLGKQPRILDLGCGTGELVVRMNVLGFEATGIDLHEKHLELARILAKENSLPDTLFVLNKSNRLPFEDNSFDVITLFSVLEHLSDATLKWLLPELKRICWGVMYVLVPNRLKITDDHTRLHFVPWMPHWLATLYVKSRGHKHRYFISESSTWDVYHRGYGRVVSLFQNYGFSVKFPPDKVIYPLLEQCPPIFQIGGNLRLCKKKFFVGVPLPYNAIIKLGYPKQAFYPYFNLIFVPPK